MTPRSPSRGILYSEPPRSAGAETDEADEEIERAGEALDPVKAGANWSGAVPADD